MRGETETVTGDSAAEWEQAYVRVRPTTAPLDPARVRAAFERLHRTARRAETPIECLLAGSGGGRLEYLFGFEGHTDALESAIRSGFPEEYECTRTTLQRPPLDAAPDESSRSVAAMLSATLGGVEKPTGAAQDVTDIDASEVESSTLVDAETGETPPVAAVELHGEGERQLDWQLGFEPFEHTLEGQAIPPLDIVADRLAAAEDRVLYQVLLWALPDWQLEADDRRFRLQYNRDTFWERFVQDWVLTSVPETTASGEPDIETLNRSSRERLLALEERDPQRSFGLNVRAVAVGPTARRTLERLTDAFEPIHTPYYWTRPVITEGVAAHEVLERLDRRTTIAELSWAARLRRKLPLAPRTLPWLVCDSSTLGSFWLLAGDRLAETPARAIGRRVPERTGLSLPSREQLAYYRDGMLLGQALTPDHEPDVPISLPPDAQTRHVVVIGATGFGKSTTASTAFVTNVAYTAGATIMTDPKGDGMLLEYLRAHYARYGTLDNVLYFDCTEVIPALPIFDIRDQLAAGIAREEAVEHVAKQFNEILVGIMSEDRYHQAIRSPDIITHLVKALFDPVHGADAYSYRDLRQALTRMQATRDAPPVENADLEDMLNGVVSSDPRTFDLLMGGVANRIEKVVLDYRLAALFGHVADDPAEEAGERTTPHFDFLEHLDSQTVILFDMGGLDTEAKRLFTLVILSKLWTALKRRRQTHTDPFENTAFPLVNLYVDEAASVAQSEVLPELLSQSRSFDLSVTLALQYPGQLEAANESAYREVLNDVSTFLVGNVGVDPLLAERLATDDLDSRAIAARLRSLRRGEWLVKLPAPFFGEEPRPFYLKSAPLPPGHPDGDAPLSPSQQLAFEALVDVVKERTATRYGIPLDTDFDDGLEDLPEHSTTDASAPGPLWPAPTEPVAANAGSTTDTSYARRGLIYSKRQPKHASYHADLDAIVCNGCQRRYDPTADGMKRALSCCFELEQTDRDDIPVIDYTLKLTPDEREATGYTDQQLWFLAAVHYAQHRRFDPAVEYDLLRDSMIRLQEYTGVSPDDVQELLDAGLLRHDCNHPHRLYSCSSAGRQLLNETTREGLDYGDGAGDLGESSQHAMAVDLGRLFIEREFVDDPDSSVTQALSYHAVPGETDHRLDVAGLNAAGEIVVTLEAERINHDLLEAVPSDFDKMAACTPEEAIWLAMDREGAHEILRALNEPKHGPPRVTKTYSKNTAPQRFTIDTPGCTQFYTVGYLQKRLVD